MHQKGHRSSIQGQGFKDFWRGYFYNHSEYIISGVFSLQMSFCRISYLFRKSNGSTVLFLNSTYIWAASSEFVSSSIPSRQILTAHAQPFRGAKDLAFYVWASSGGSGETARMRRLAWTFAARIGDKYQIRLTRSIFLLRVNICWRKFHWHLKVAMSYAHILFISKL